MKERHDSAPGDRLPRAAAVATAARAIVDAGLEDFMMREFFPGG